MRRRVLFAMALQTALLCAVATAQVPKAVITGPKDSRPGALVVLDASESTGVGRLWLLAAAPEETSFLPVDSGLRCIFASPTPGMYRFVLVVSGTNANGGPAADMATHSVTLRSPDVPPPVPPPLPDPTTTPLPSRPTAAVYVFEKDQSAIPRAVQSALQQLNAAGSVVATEFERDTTDGEGEVPDQYRAALDAAVKAGLPCLVVMSGGTVLRTVRDPKTEQQVLEAAK